MVARIFLAAAALGAAAVVAQVPNTPPTYQLNKSTIIMVRARRASASAEFRSGSDALGRYRRK